MIARRWLTGLLPSLLAGLLSACVPFRQTAAPAAEPASRLVLALDGIDYRDILAARERGLFAAFRPPSRLVSTFPSISDIAWHQIFGVLPPRGYQRVHYSVAYNERIGAPLDAIRPIEFEDRMDMAFGAKFHHLGAYLISGKVARGEVDAAVRDFFTFSGRPTVYVYNVGPDALQHTRGDLTGYLQHLDERLDSLQVDYRRRTGRDLEIVMLSDHGHNRAVDAQFLSATKSLESHGFRIVDRLETPMDVAFSVDGVTTGFGVFAMPDSLAVLAQVLANTDGVALVSTRINDSVFVVEDQSRHARIERRGRTRYRYVPLQGDPFRYTAALERMRADGALDGDGFADAATWLRYTAAEEFPAAVVRIAQGHTDVTLNSAPILVSLIDEYRVGLGLVSMANRLRPLGGTHGALSATNSLGVLMTNFQDTHDDLTASVGGQFGGFADFGAVHIKTSGARLTNRWLIGRDERSPFHGMVATVTVPSRADALELWIPERQEAEAVESDTLRVEMRRIDRDAPRNTLVATSRLPMPLPASRGATNASAGDGWRVAPDRLHYLLPLSQLKTDSLAANATYELQVTLEREAGSGKRKASTTLATIVVRSTARGELWPY